LELIVTTAALLLVIVVASIILYRRIEDATKEYEGSKEAVRNITFGFTRQVNRLQNDITNTENIATMAKIVASDALKNSSEAKETTLKGLEAVKGLQNRVESTESAVEFIKKEIHKLSTTPKIRNNFPQEISAAIPVQKGNVLQQLTDTELNALKKITQLGEGTVPEIKEHISLTREHTARMLKKLYESGFVDRNTNAMPYHYSVRREIRDLIQQQPEQKSSL
jgi:mannitol-specific phosphotransferase system IIBC component